MVILKSVDDIVDSTINYFVQENIINEKDQVKPGSILRTLIEAIAIEIYNTSNKLIDIDKNSRITTAEGNYLDQLATPFGVKRMPDENDLSFKSRLLSIISTRGIPNKQNILNELYNIEHLGFVDIINSTKGPGTFTVFYRPDYPENKSTVYNNICSVLEKIIPPGIFYEVKHPGIVTVSINIHVDGMYNNEAVINSIKEYVNNIKPGGTLYISKIISSVMSIGGVNNCFIVSININDSNNIYANEISLDTYDVFSVKDINIV